MMIIMKSERIRVMGGKVTRYEHSSNETVAQYLKLNYDTTSPKKTGRRWRTDEMQYDSR